MKGSRACWVTLSVFLTTKEHVKLAAGSFPLCTHRLPEALLRLAYQSYTSAQGWFTWFHPCLCCPLPQAHLGIQELEDPGSTLSSTWSEGQPL